MDDYLKKQTLEKLSNARNILIALAQNSDLDGLAAALALYLSLKKVGKSAIVSAKEPSVGEAQQLYAIDKIGATNHKNDLLITVSNAVKNVDKVSYYLESDQLKIVVHCLPTSDGISTNDVSLDKTVSKPDLIFAIDFESADHLKQEITHEQNIDSNTWLISINLKDVAQKFAQVHYYDKFSTSLSELTANLLQSLSLPFDEDISFNLYSGIKFATNAFSPKFTNPSTLEIAQYLLKFGAGSASLAQKRGDKISKTESPTLQNAADKNLYNESAETPIEQIEAKENLKESWLKPPKIYRGSKSFDRES